MARHKFSNKDKEIRLGELRAESNEEGSMIVEGYASVFNQETLIGDDEFGFIEVIDRDAFKDTDMKDCVFKYNHKESSLVLARTRNDSLKLSVDDYGLKIRAELLDTTNGKDIYKCIKSGLLDKMSFAFTIAEDGQRLEKVNGKTKRTVTKIGKLWDVSVVDTPAYDGSSIYARSKEIVGEQLRKLQNSLDSERELDSSRLELEKLKARIKGGKF